MEPLPVNLPCPGFPGTRKGIMAGGLDNFDELAISAVTEIANVGLGHAATALSDLTGQSFDIDVPNVTATVVTEFASQARELFQPGVGVLVGFTGDADGQLLFIFPWDSAQKLWAALLGTSPESAEMIDELSASAMLEIGNVVCSNFLNAISDLTSLKLHAECPQMAIDFVDAILAEASFAAEVNQRIAVSIETHLNAASLQCEAFCVAMPSETGLRTILSALGLEVAA